jgi:hypothetical protein
MQAVVAFAMPCLICVAVAGVAGEYQTNKNVARARALRVMLQTESREAARRAAGKPSEPTESTTTRSPSSKVDS